MLETKNQIRFFSVTQWEKEQEYLRSMHQQGWAFVDVSVCRYHFIRCEPEDMIYQLDYPKVEKEQKEEYLQMFRDCGWEYLQDFAGYSYFRKPAAQMQGEEEIFCDDESRLEMLQRILKGRMLPLLILFFCTLLPMLYLQWVEGHMVFLWIYAALVLIYLVIFIQTALFYLKFKKKLS